MKKGLSLMEGAVIGAGLMFFLDPDRGRRRRALIRDQAIHWKRKTAEAAGATSRDLRNRAQGFAALLRSWITEGGPVSDNVLEARVRSALGMVARHPAAIRVQIQNGVAALNGSVLADEADAIVSTVRKIHGVTSVDNRLRQHDEASGVPDLQGGSREARRGSRFELMQRPWSPTARTITAAVGSAVLLYGLRRRTITTTALGFIGFVLLLRGGLNRDLATLVGLGRTGETSGRRRQDARAGMRRLRLRDVMTSDVEVIGPDESLQTAAETMKRLNVGAIPVCDGDRLLGMVTDRDIVVRVVAERRDPRTEIVRNAMTGGVSYGYEDDGVQRASDIMAVQQIRRLPVVNRDRRLVGIVSLGDLAAHTPGPSSVGETLQRVSQPAEPRR